MVVDFVESQADTDFEDLNLYSQQTDSLAKVEVWVPKVTGEFVKMRIVAQLPNIQLD